MPARSGRSPRSSPPSPEGAKLKIPLARAQSELWARIDAGRELASTLVHSLEGDPRTGQVVLGLPHGSPGQPAYPELDELRHRVRQWTDYNQTWLNMNLGGEAASEYDAASSHVGFGADDPLLRLRYLREDITSEISKLESIYSRLPLWPPEGDTASDGRDITEPATSSLSADATEAATSFATDRRSVMVIYGHDTEANDALFDWLRAIGLQPREWSQLVQASGSGSPYIGQVLDRAFQDAQAVVALFTPDEYVTARTAPPNGQSAGRFQARPNVLIEAGMALVTHPTRTVMAVLGNQELPSDLAGRHYIRLSNTNPAPLHELAARLRDAGCGTDTTGTDWLNPARFPDRDTTTQPPPRARRPPGTTTERPDESHSPARDDAQPRNDARRASEDTAARQVTVVIEPQNGENFTHLITVSAPIIYTLKWTDAQIVWQTNSGLGMTSTGFTGDPPRVDDHHRRYTFRASVSPQIRTPEPIIRFVDQDGHLYYQFRHYTQRFSQNTDWIKAASDIDQWLRTGPNPD